MPCRGHNPPSPAASGSSILVGISILAGISILTCAVSPAAASATGVTWMLVTVPLLDSTVTPAVGAVPSTVREGRTDGLRQISLSCALQNSRGSTRRLFVLAIH